jgi:transcriptional regulator with XRE-family HTH domain
VSTQILRPVGDSREALRCEHCKLVQFPTSNGNCRRCKRPLKEEAPPAQPSSKKMAPMEDPRSSIDSLGRTIAALRHKMGLSQPKLAAKMSVHRTYVSKVENSKAIPLISCCERFASALGVNISELFPVPEDQIRMLISDPLIAEITPFLPFLTAEKRDLILSEVYAMCVRPQRLPS